MAVDPPKKAADCPENLYLVPYRLWQETIGQSDDLFPFFLCNDLVKIPDSEVLEIKITKEGESLLIDTFEKSFADTNFALIVEDMWSGTFDLSQTFSSMISSIKQGNPSCINEDPLDTSTLQLTVSTVFQENRMNVKLNKKDNADELYERICQIFGDESARVFIWDFCSHLDRFYLKYGNRDSQQQTDQEISLELQVYNPPDSINYPSEGKKNEQDILSILCSESFYPDFDFENIFFPGKATSVGLTGLQNLGHTCFINSAVQCLAHTPKFVDYFIEDYVRGINPDEMSSATGQLASEFGDLLRQLWSSERNFVPPIHFKLKIDQLAPQFLGHNQHDSQEFLEFLLVKLHEDLNRVKFKPDREAKDLLVQAGQGADECWAHHLSLNDSIIIDVFYAQYKSALACTHCNMVSDKFEPFMSLSLPLPSMTKRIMTLTVFSTDGVDCPSEHTISVPKFGNFKDLAQAISISCSLRSDEKLLMAKISCNHITHFLEEPSDSLSLVKNDDQLAAYRLPKDEEEHPHPLVVFMHEHLMHGNELASDWKAHGLPLITKLRNIVYGSDIQNLFLNLVKPFLKPRKASLDDQDDVRKIPGSEGTQMGDSLNPIVSVDGNPTNESGNDCHFKTDWQFYLTDDKGSSKGSKIELNEPFPITDFHKPLYVIVCFPSKAIERYEVSLLIPLPEIFRSEYSTSLFQLPTSLYGCFDDFLKDEPLGPDNMWTCPRCKVNRLATKKLEFVGLPEILIIHLKRFSQSMEMHNKKLETFVDFPIDDLDLSNHCVAGVYNWHGSKRYQLYAVINHYGNVVSGQYTAYIHQDVQWYKFDDAHVTPIAKEQIKTSAAYVLFYRRV